MEIETKDLKAFITEEEPSFKRGEIYDKKSIRNIYSRRLEDLNFNDLEMIGYDNPNTFVKEWAVTHGSFDKDKIVWVVVYVKVE